jgi:hypothetical protein
MPREHRSYARVLIATCLLLSSAIAAHAAVTRAAGPEDEEAPEASRPKLRAGVLPQGFVLSGRLSDPAWKLAADSVTGLTTIEPREGEVPTARTVIKVLANAHELVVGAHCYDPDPSGIVSYSKARDAALDEEDHLVLVLDTFQDERSGYAFAVNPSGARFDGLVTAQGEEVNSAWDTIWDAKTWRDSTGWYAEIRIPAKSLGFRSDITSWGFNVQRRVPRLQETSRWSGAARDYEVYQTSHSGVLTDLPRFDVGAGLSIRPAIVTRTRKSSAGAHTDTDGDLSLDVSKTIGPNLLSSLTINTDFAETEVETRQINLTRFPLFFPEKRSFFLAGADIFDFGLGLGEETLVPFHSRRIGLFGITEEEQAEIPIDAGAKISGRVGETNLGALVVGTRRVENLQFPEEDLTLTIPKTTMGAVRIKQNILEESSVGMIATFGDQQGRADSWMGGADFTYQTSGFMDDKNLLVGVWGLLTDREHLVGDKSAYGASIDYPNDLVDVNFSSTRIGDGFDPSLSFVPRKGVDIWNLSALFNPRPTWPGVREVTQETNFKLFNTPNNSSWTSYEISARPLDVLFQNGDRVEFAVEPEGDRPTDTFSISDGVDLPAGSYEWTRFLVGAHSAPRRRVSGDLTLEAGDYYNGDLTTLTAGLTLRSSSFLSLEGTFERSTGTVTTVVDAGGRDAFTVKRLKQALIGVRIALNASSNLQLTSFTQYDTDSRELGSNNRLRWTFAPQGDLFVVYNHNLARNLDNSWHFLSSELPVKLQYTWRF